MVNHPKFKEQARTTVNIEKWKLDLIHSIRRAGNPKVTDSHIFDLGFKAFFETGIQNGRFSSVVLEQYLEEYREKQFEISGIIDQIETALELKKNQELREETKKEILTAKAVDVFGPNGRYYTRLPEVAAIPEDHADFWNTSAAKLTKICGFTVSVSDCQNIVRRRVKS